MIAQSSFRRMNFQAVHSLHVISKMQSPDSDAGVFVWRKVVAWRAT
jgi:hypothetical protein